MKPNAARSKIDSKPRPILTPAQRELLRPFFVLCTVLCELLALGVVPGCGSGSGGRESVATRTESAPLSLQTILPGKIVPATGVVEASSGQMQIVGETSGAVDVSPFGTLTYDVPIWAPDGVRGMQPQLKVGYRSNGDVGLLGPKWGLTGFGLSVIKRCRQTLAQDSVTRPIDFQNGDTYCLDGERLVRVSGSPNGPGEFRTQVNPFAKIVAVASAGTGGLSFRIFQPDGRIYHYGRTDASRLWGNPVIFPNPNNITGQFLPRQVAAYYVDKIEDRFGNSMLISYRNQPTLPAGQNPPIATQMPDELQPLSIQWGGVGDAPGQRSIQFEYQPPAGGHSLTHQRYFGGLGVNLRDGLTALKIYGPDGLGNVPLLKVYNFSYALPTITLEHLLSQIQECDGNNVCKRPTKVAWEPGSLQYDSGTAISGMTDVQLSGYQMTLSGPPPKTVGPNEYRRILVADLNNDGRDDIVYRARDLCLTWYARLAVPGGTFDAGTAIGVGAAADPRCINPLASNAPFPGDPIITDVNRDGFPDILMQVGDVRWQVAVGVAPLQTTYRVYFNTAAGGNTVAFRPGIDFETPFDFKEQCAGMGCTYISGTVDAPNPGIAVADVNGDGLPEIIRPVVPSLSFGDPAKRFGRLWAANVGPCTNPGGCGQVGADIGVVTIPDVSIGQQITGFSALDIDGDGVAEILRDQPPTTPSGAYMSLVTSPTMNGVLASSPTNTPFMKPQIASPPSVRWVLDLNGDGLKDYATVYINDPTKIVTNINNGKGFSINKVVELPPFSNAGGIVSESARIGAGWRSGFDAGARVVDYNLDGRDDLVLVDRDPDAAGGQGRTHQMVLLSDGTGDFRGMISNTIPIGDPADGWSWFTRVPNTNGYRTSVSLDYNGDGLPDFLQIEGGVVKLYTRQGKKPDMVTSVTEGTGRKLTLEYTPVTDSSVYTPDLAACASDAAHLSCLTGGRLLVKSLTESGDTRLAKQRFTYRGGLYDRGGLGFLGFEGIDVAGPHTRLVMTTYDPTTRSVPTFGGYTYPNAGRPKTVTTQADTPSERGRRFTTSTFEYTFGNVIFDPRTLVGRNFTVLPKKITETLSDCVPTIATVGCLGPSRPLGTTTDTFSYDGSFGTLLTRQTDHSALGSGVIQTERTVNTYYPPDTNNWLTGVVQQTQVTSTINPSAMGTSVTRTTKFTPEPAVNPTSGYLTGETRNVEIEPGTDTSVHLMRTFAHDPRGRVTSVSEADYPSSGECNTTCNASCNTSCTNGCAGSANPGACIGGCMSGCMGSCVGACQTTPRTDARTTAYFYEHGDGVYVTTTIDAMNNITRVWRHIGLGLIVQTDDENGFPTKYTYDSFGRPLSQTAPSGQSMTAAYDDTTVPTFLGANFTLLPGGSSQRGVAVHVDPFGNSTSQTSSVSSIRSLTKTTLYDDIGRVSQVKLVSKSGSTNTTLNTETFTLDDANRVVSDCHLTSSDSAIHCKSNTYDGLTVTSVNEAGRTVTSATDSLGRLSTQQASIGTGPSTATFTYGPFDLLARESVEDGSGFTNISYDVLGRPASIQRRDAGTRRTTYNAFGDVTSTFKVDSLGAARETVTYGRDKLGRVTTMQSPGGGTGAGVPPAINRRYFWDAPQSTTSGFPFPRGKLNDIVDSGNQTSVHLEYNSAGLLSQKSLTVFNASLGTSGANETYTAIFTYDSQGRADTFLYPKAPTETQGLAVTYAYDPFTGTPSSIKDAATSATIWSVTGRNQLGQITGESMAFGTTTLTRATTYSLQDGQVTRASIGTTFTRSQLDYTYQADGLPQTFSRSGVGGASVSTFGNDNLARLTSWTPASGAPTVSYAYDSDGNMLSRTWSGETVTYGRTTGGSTMTQLTARTVTTKRGTQAAQTDTYRVDEFGRIFDTPAVAIRMTDDNKIGSITEKANGQVDTLVYDGLGGRVLTLYGNRGSAGSLLEFDDLFELKRDGTNSSTGTEARCRLRAGDRLIGDVIRKGTAAQTATFYLEDNVHSVVAEATSGGTVTARQRRDPFGSAFTSSTQPFLPSDPAAANPDGSSRLGFGSHDRDKGWGLVDMLARAYSPRLGRFISPDLVIANPRDRREFNPFAYVQNNPTAKFDPLGLAGGGPSSGGDFGPPSGYGGGGGTSGSSGEGGGSGGQGGGPGGQDGADHAAPGSGSGPGRGEQSTSGTPGGGDARGAAYQAGAHESGVLGLPGSDGHPGPVYQEDVHSTGGGPSVREGDGFDVTVAGNTNGNAVGTQSDIGGTGGGSGQQGGTAGHGGESGNHGGQDGYYGGYGGGGGPRGGAGGGGWGGGVGGGAGGMGGGGGGMGGGGGGMGGNPGGGGDGPGRGTWGGPFNPSGTPSPWNVGHPTGGGLVGFSGTVMAGPIGVSGGAYLMIDNQYGLSIMLTMSDLAGLGAGAAVGSNFGLFSGPPEGQGGGSNTVCIETPGVSVSASQLTGDPYGASFTVGTSSPTLAGAMQGHGHAAIIGVMLSTFD